MHLYLISFTIVVLSFVTYRIEAQQTKKTATGAPSGTSTKKTATGAPSGTPTKKTATGAPSGTPTKKTTKSTKKTNPPVELKIVKTGDYTSTEENVLSCAEPYKSSILALYKNGAPLEIENCAVWDIHFIPREDEQWSEEDLNLAHVDEESCISSIELMFKIPGKYKVEVFNDGSSLISTEVRVAYARRDVIDLSPADWEKYVEAIWELKNLSSEEGKNKYNCENFYNIDVFTTMHGVHSQNVTCDQLHFSIMQEWAHQSWMTLLEKALQCVHPSIAMPYYNVAKDFRKYYNSTVGIKSMLESPIFGDDYYGGGLANWDEREDPHDPYYVEDGRFAWFPLRQNRTGLCDESAGIFDDSIYIPFCKKVMEDPDFLQEWADSNAETSGIWVREPRKLDSYEYLSARRWYTYGTVGDTALPPFIPSHEYLELVINLNNAFDQFKLIATGHIHGYAHIALSGMWGGGINSSTLTAETAFLTPNMPILQLISNSGMMNSFAWFDEWFPRKIGCYKCSEFGCELDFPNVIAKGCYNYPNISTPDMKKPYWTDYAIRGNSWYTFLELMNVGSWMSFAGYGFGAHHPNSGTFSRHPWSNQDPFFYAHHAFTFLVNDLATKRLEERGLASPPLFGLDNLQVPECPGFNEMDTSVFRNVVRYKIDQEVNTQHTWSHIMEMFSPDRRDFEWVINDDMLTDFSSTLGADESCVEPCIDNGNFIVDVFPDVPVSNVCQAYIDMLQNFFQLSKEEACHLPFKEVEGFPDWLADFYNPYSLSCMLTCGFCSPVCDTS